MFLHAIGEAVNALLDSVVAVTERLLELPLFALLGVLLVLVALLIATRRLARRPRWSWTARPVFRGVLGLAAVALLLLLVDQRVAAMQKRIDALREQGRETTWALLDNQARATTARPALFDVASARAALGEHFEGVSVRALACHDAVDLVWVHLDAPLVEAWLAIVDLRHPAVQVVLDGNFDEKTLTSAFGRDRACLVAINGEAGASPAPHCGLGPWQGNFMIGGELLQSERPDQPLPFLTFDEQNRATFTPESATARPVAPAAANIIWGRVDCIVGGEVVTEAFRLNQPRTAMGIDRDGARLYLLVVDGRQVRHSWGFTRPETGYCLQAFGATDAMLCDEGGSSCMYVAPFGGLVNVPSDGDGTERPTYTHFGVALRAPPAEGR